MLDYAGYSSARSGYVSVSPYFGDAGIVSIGQELYGSVIIDINAGDDAMVQTIYGLKVKTAQADGNGVYIEQDIPFSNIVSVYSPDGVVKVSEQSGSTIIVVYDLKTDIDNWTLIGDTLIHDHNVKPKPYATIYIKYLG